jgi:hypothetical protein
MHADQRVRLLGVPAPGDGKRKSKKQQAKDRAKYAKIKAARKPLLPRDTDGGTRRA